MNSGKKNLSKAGEISQTDGPDKSCGKSRKAASFHTPALFSASAALFLAGGILAWFFKGRSVLLLVQSGAVCALFGYAAAVDFKTHLLPLWVPVALLVPAGLNLAAASNIPGKLADMVFGAAVSALPFLISIFIAKRKKKHHTGWGDVELMAVSGLILGLERGYEALILSLILSAVIEGVKILAKRSDKNKPFPFIPYIAAGSIVSYFV